MSEEDGFVRMYVRDFTTLAARAESGLDVEVALMRRISEAQSHAVLMDRRKTGDHLAAVAERLRLESRRTTIRPPKDAPDPAGVAVRRTAFLLRVALLLETTPQLAPAASERVRDRVTLAR
jgi:hypothetical protein